MRINKDSFIFIRQEKPTAYHIYRRDIVDEYNNNGVKHSHYSIFTVLKKCRSLKKAINWGLENYQGIRYVRGLDGKEIDTYELKINGLL